MKGLLSLPNQLRLVSVACLVLLCILSETLRTSPASFLLENEATLCEIGRQSYLSKEYASLEEQQDRKNRFPSVEQRVKIYMGSWYVPPCPGNSKGIATFNILDNPRNTTKYVLREVVTRNAPNPRTFVLPSYKIPMSQAFVMQEEFVNAQCYTLYCDDMMRFLLPSVRRVDATSPPKERRKPIVLQFGDGDYTSGHVDADLKGQLEGPLRLPVIKKFRISYGGWDAIDSITSKTCSSGPEPIPPVEYAAPGGKRIQDIIWRFTSKRHYFIIPYIPAQDIPWSEKESMAAYRGALTGTFRESDMEEEFKGLNNREICMKMHRCRLVYTTNDSPLIDAKLVQPREALPDKIGDVVIAGYPMSKATQLQHKAIIMLEGNDVSSGLKWALYSNSVVLAQKFKKTSWAMEEMLEPWIHYIPLNEELDDVEEKVQWVIDNDKEAEAIARRGSLWIKDLLYHPDAEDEDEKVNDEIIRRLRMHFREDPNLTPA